MRRWAGLVPALALVVSGLSACGGDDEQHPTALPGPEDAAKGEKVDVDAFLDELGASFHDGATARVAFDVTGQARLRGRGTVEYGVDGMDVDLRLDDWQVKGGTVDLRTVGDATYMRVPESRGLWVAISAEQLGLTDSVLEDADPRNQIDGASDDITEVRFTGDDTVAGKAVRGYEVVARGGAEQPGASAAPSAPVVTDYWFDADGRVLRRSVDLGASGSASFAWAEWDQPVDIAPPPDDETITVAQLERMRRQQEGDGHG